MLSRLTIYLPRQPTKTFLLRDEASYLVGRDPACDLVVEDGRVSREHARLSPTGEGYRIANLGSKNGLTIDNRQVEEGELCEACWIGLGGVIARFEPVHEDAGWAAERRRRLQTTLDAHRQFREETESVDRLLDRLLRSVIDVGQAERGFVLLAMGDGEFEIVASHGLSADALSEHGFRGSISAVSRVLESGEPIAESDALEDSFLGERRSVLAQGIRGLICLPLATGGRTIGAIYADSRKVGAAFDELDLEILGALSSHAALSLWVVGLNRELKSLAGDLPTQVAGRVPEAQGLAGYPSWSALSAAAREETA